MMQDKLVQIDGGEMRQQELIKRDLMNVIHRLRINQGIELELNRLDNLKCSFRAQNYCIWKATESNETGHQIIADALKYI